MISTSRGKKKNTVPDKGMVDNGTLRVIILASLIMVVSVLLTGIASYNIARDAIISKLKSQDLIYIAQSIASKIDGRIERAKDTSLMLARDPAIVYWVKSREQDEALTDQVEKKITGIARDYDYSNSFIVSSITRHYWTEDGEMIDTMSREDPDDSWFFNTISSKKPVSIDIDYNKELGDTFVFVNALVGNVNSPIAVTGVGLNLKDITREFQGYKFGEKSNLWLIDNKGDIYISEDPEHRGRNITHLLAADISKRIVSGQEETAAGFSEITYKNEKGEIYDLIYQSIKSTDWKLVLQISRSESVSVVGSIKSNTAAACFITLLLVMMIFYWISNRIANPYKRAVLLSQELERKVNERTQELNEKNIKIMDSIEYAKIIQESILPSEEEMEKIMGEHFILWKPRDMVGGDFYWLKKLEGGYVAAVGDCTGHGVPGALMTMAVNSILNHVVDGICGDNPALILKEMNRLLKQTLNRRNSQVTVGDGLDCAVFYVSKHGRMLYAGAKASLYVSTGGGLSVIKGDRKSIGYKSTLDSYEFKNHTIEIQEGSSFYITTDGYIDQNGGEKDNSFGRKRFEEVINKCCQMGMSEQKEIFIRELKEYMGSEPQRDDITVMGFKA